MIGWLKKKRRNILLKNRSLINYAKKKELKNRNITILSNNCIGGLIYHDLDHPFLSPTINLYIGEEDFLSFLENIHHYLSCELHFIDSEYNYPVGKLDDITIRFVHYKTELEAFNKWEARKQRIQWDNIYVMMNDRHDYSETILKRFDNLQYANKVIFTHTKNESVKTSYFINVPKSRKKGMWEGLVTFKNIFGKRY